MAIQLCTAASSPPPKYSGNVFIVCAFCVSKYTAENNGKFSLRLKNMFKCSTQISSLYGLKIHIEKLGVLFKKKKKIISLDANTCRAPQHGLSTACQNSAPKFYKKICMLLSKYISNTLYIINLNNCDKLISWSLKILANIITFLNKIMRAGNNVPSWAWCRTGPNLT